MAGKASTYLMLIATATLWGSAFVTSKIAVGAVPPSVAAFIRFGLGAIFAILLLLYIHRRDKTVPIVPNGSWRTLVVLGLVGVAVYNLFFFWGLAYSNASDGSMIIPIMSPVLTVIFAAVFLRERVLSHQIVGLLLTLFGSVVFFSGSGVIGKVDHLRIIGDLLFLAAAACWSTYTLLGKTILHKTSPLLVTAYTMLIGAVALGVFSLPELVQVEWSTLGAGFWLNQVYLALFPSVLANWFYTLGVKNIGPSRAATFMNLVPVSGLILSAIVLGDVLTLVQLCGAVFMMAGVWIVNRRKAATAAVVREG